jgi:queuosine precursor transporter
MKTEKVKKERFSLKEWFKKDLKETKALFKGLPAIPFTMVCMSFILMNLLATVPLFNTPWIAGDVGFLVSWLAFLFGDMFVKRYGAKGSIKIQIAALLVSLFVLGILAGGSAIEVGLFGQNYTLGLFNWSIDLEHGAVTLWTLGASAIAFLISNIFNSIISKFILTKFKERTSFKAYATAAYTSTFIGQFVDNIIFAMLFTFIASRIPQMQTAWSLQPVTFLAALTCALTGAVLELLLEVIFSPIGFKVAERWRKEGVGAEYIALVPDAQEVNNNVDCVTDIIG